MEPRASWNHIRAFLAVAEEGSLSAAARKLGQTQPTLGRQIFASEQSLGVLLFDRLGKQMVLNTNGQNLLASARTMNDAAEQLQMQAKAKSESLEGAVTITASELWACYVVAPVIGELRTKAPKIDINLRASGVLHDLRRREADIALRHVRPNENELYGRLLGESQAHLYGSKAYFARRSLPKTIEELNDHDWIGSENTEQMARFLETHGVHIDEGSISIRTESGNVLWELVHAGAGISYLPDNIARHTQDLVQVNCAPIITFPTWLVAHAELMSNRAMRTVFDFLAENIEKKL